MSLFEQGKCLDLRWKVQVNTYSTRTEHWTKNSLHECAIGNSTKRNQLTWKSLTITQIPRWHCKEKGDSTWIKFLESAIQQGLNPFMLVVAGNSIEGINWISKTARPRWLHKYRPHWHQNWKSRYMDTAIDLWQKNLLLSTRQAVPIVTPFSRDKAVYLCISDVS